MFLPPPVKTDIGWLGWKICPTTLKVFPLSIDTANPMAP
jgi:hypothetical protein